MKRKTKYSISKKTNKSKISVYAIVLLAVFGVYGKYVFEKAFSGEFKSLPFYFEAETEQPTVTFPRTEEDGDEDPILTTISDISLVVKNYIDENITPRNIKYEISIVDSKKFTFQEGDTVTREIDTGSKVEDKVDLNLVIKDLEDPQKKVKLAITSKKPYKKTVYIEYDVVQEGAIQTIEDLLDFKDGVESGDENVISNKFKLTRNLDFTKEDSYDNAQTTEYGDFDKDGTDEELIHELTNKDGNGFIPIGQGSSDIKFSGKLDGGNHTLNNLFISNQKDNSLKMLGLFSYTNDVTILNLNLTGEINTKTNTVAAGLAAQTNGNSKITNVTTDVNVTSNIAGSSVGGIVGNAYDNAQLTNCTNKGAITGANNAGGILGFVGAASNATLDNCKNEGTITNNKGPHVGGLIGRDDKGTSKIIINKSSNSGIVKIATEEAKAGYAGGLIGLVYGVIEINEGSNSGAISNENPEYCPTNDIQVGGLIGGSMNNADTDTLPTIKLKDSSNLGDISNGNASGGLVGHSYSDIIVENSKNSGTITNTTGTYVGGLIGKDANEKSVNTIKNSFNAGTIKSDKTTTGEISVGGVYGMVHGSIVANKVHNTGAVESTTTSSKSVKTGGIIGYKTNHERNVFIDSCYNTGDVNVSVLSDSEILPDSSQAGLSTTTIDASELPISQQGGIIGQIDIGDLVINKSYNTGDITATSVANSYSSGIIGMSGDLNYEYSQSKSYYIVNTYNTGTVTDSSANSKAAGFIPYNYSAKTVIANSYNEGDITANEIAVGIINDSNKITLFNVYNIGNIDASTAYSLGSFNEEDSITDAYYNSSITGSNIDSMGTGKSLNEIKNQDFVSTLIDNITITDISTIDEFLVGYRLSNWTLNDYPVIVEGDNSHTGAELLLTLPNGLNVSAEGGMYRFQGACSNGTDCKGKIDNYICFGTSNLQECKANPSQYLYRIIGIDEKTRELKLIKKETLKFESTEPSWFTAADDTAEEILWPQSNLNKLLNGWDETLESKFVGNSEFSYLSKENNWYSMIAAHQWYYGDMTSDAAGANQTASGVAAIENGEANSTWATRSSSKKTGLFNKMNEEDASDKKISLINISDYYYAGVKGGANCYNATANKNSDGKIPVCLNSWINLSNNDATGVDGITNDSTSNEWTMTRLGWYSNNSTNEFRAYGINPTNGYVAASTLTKDHRMRPVFYLNSNIAVIGDGTFDSPYLIQ